MRAAETYSFEKHRFRDGRKALTFKHVYRLARVAPWIIGQEAERREYSRPIGAELHGIATIQTLLGDFTLTGRADRVDFIDNLPDGGVAIIDYKAGQAPSNKQAQVYAKQLPLLGAMARAGAFDAFEAETAAILTYVSLSGADDGGIASFSSLSSSPSLSSPSSEDEDVSSSSSASSLSSAT